MKMSPKGCTDLDEFALVQCRKIDNKDSKSESPRLAEEKALESVVIEIKPI